MKQKLTTIHKGRLIENLAYEFLQAQGLQLVCKNFRSHFGEIDLIMQAQEELIFIEVRGKYTNFYGSGSESITLQKQQKIFKTALFFLKQNPLFKNFACRFDVISMSFNQAKPMIEWLPNAFSADYFYYE